MTASLSFDLPSPHVMNILVDESHIDAYQHVNNAVYVTWCDHAAWHHSAALGLPIERCLELGRGMAVLRTSIAYLRPALREESLLMATWLLPAQSRLCIRRRFQLLRPTDGITLARAEVEYACIELSSGHPVRWPAEFRPAYAIRPDVLAGLPTLAPL